MSLSSITFSGSYFMLIIVFNLKLSFVQGDKYGFIFIFQHTDCKLEHHHLLKILSFFHRFFFYICFFVKYQVSINVRFSFWFFSSSPLIHMSVSVSIPCSFFFKSLLLYSRVWGPGLLWARIAVESQSRTLAMPLKSKCLRAF